MTQAKLLTIIGVDSFETLARVCMDGAFQIVQNLVEVMI